MKTSKMRLKRLSPRPTSMISYTVLRSEWDGGLSFRRVLPLHLFLGASKGTGLSGMADRLGQSRRRTEIRIWTATSEKTGIDGR